MTGFIYDGQEREREREREGEGEFARRVK